MNLTTSQLGLFTASSHLNTQSPRPDWTKQTTQKAACLVYLVVSTKAKEFVEKAIRNDAGWKGVLIVQPTNVQAARFGAFEESVRR